ncbi:MAG: class I SAM-dependent methyltransferase [Desulfamplus sp.]|nr:class I SAM-dependent methyltransferase [Desulfamplus sp.]
MSKNIPTIDNVRKYWDNRPCNLRHSNAPIGTKEYFDQVEAKKYFVEPHIIQFSEFERWKGAKVLEIGCGIGTMAISFARAGAQYTGVELSRESLELTRKRFELYGLAGDFYIGNAEELSQFLPLQSYDLIYSFGVIHHSPHPEHIMAQIQKYMNPESEFRFMLYAKHSWKSILIEAGLEQPEAQSGCPIAKTFSRDEIVHLLSDFQIIEIYQDHIFPYVIEQYISHKYELQPWFKAMPQDMFKALEHSLGWHTLIKCKLQQSKMK